MALFRAENGQQVFIYSMGKKLRLTAIADNDEDANKHMARTDDAVIACFGTLVLMASRYDNGSGAP